MLLLLGIRLIPVFSSLLKKKMTTILDDRFVVAIQIFAVVYCKPFIVTLSPYTSSFPLYQKIVTFTTCLSCCKDIQLLDWVMLNIKIFIFSLTFLNIIWLLTTNFIFLWWKLFRNFLLSVLISGKLILWRNIFIVSKWLLTTLRQLFILCSIILDIYVLKYTNLFFYYTLYILFTVLCY